MEKVRKRARGHRPRLGIDGEVDAAILRAMSGSCSLEAIALQICERFPRRFASQAEALSRVSDLSERYSQ
jgi:hypothetical protein